MSRFNPGNGRLLAVGYRARRLEKSRQRKRVQVVTELHFPGVPEADYVSVGPACALTPAAGAIGWSWPGRPWYNGDAPPRLRPLVATSRTWATFSSTRRAACSDSDVVVGRKTVRPREVETAALLLTPASRFGMPPVSIRDGGRPGGRPGRRRVAPSWNCRGREFTQPCGEQAGGRPWGLNPVHPRFTPRRALACRGHGMRRRSPLGPLATGKELAPGAGRVLLTLIFRPDGREFADRRNDAYVGTALSPASLSGGDAGTGAVGPTRYACPQLLPLYHSNPSRDWDPGSATPTKNRRASLRRAVPPSKSSTWVCDTLRGHAFRTRRVRLGGFEPRTVACGSASRLSRHDRQGVPTL